MNDKALELLQTRIAFLERANTELSDVVFRQQREIQALAARIKEIAEGLDAVQEGNEEQDPLAQKPPHY